MNNINSQLTFGRNDFMRVRDLKEILKDLPDDMLILVPVTSDLYVNEILGFRKVLTAGIVACGTEEDYEAFSMNGASEGNDIVSQVANSGLNITVKKVLYGDCL